MTSTAADFKNLRREGAIITLPASGLQVRARTVSLQALVRRGIMPQELLSLALQGFPEMSKLENARTPKEISRLTEMVVNLSRYEYAVLSDMLIEPHLTEDESDTTGITLEDIPEDDKAFLISISQLPIREWESFLQAKRERLPSVDDEPGTEGEAECSSGYR